MFKFLDYTFEPEKNLATFRYEGANGTIFTEKVEFGQIAENYDKNLLNRALFLAFIILGTSYYKSRPTPSVILPASFEEPQADFFNLIYQEGLSQFAFENGLKRSDLPNFKNSDKMSPISQDIAKNSDKMSPISKERLVLISGGKDSLLTAELLRRENAPFRTVFISNAGDHHPTIIDDFGKPLIIKRQVDRENLKKAGGLNGHVPVTFINESLALVQAILLNISEIVVGLGREGEEPHAFIDNLAVNHQWSKTPFAQNALNTYIKTYLSPDLAATSLLSKKSELEIAGDFVKLCWEKFGNRFSSCNVANYRQNIDNKNLKWCGECPKCANSFLLFAPYLPLEEQLKLFGHDLFTDQKLTETFKGLLGVDGFMKPFECVGEIAELRIAYHHRAPSYGSLPFAVPEV